MSLQRTIVQLSAGRRLDPGFPIIPNEMLLNAYPLRESNVVSFLCVSIGFLVKFVVLEVLRLCLLPCGFVHIR